jgi:hypothetical protein
VILTRVTSQKRADLEGPKYIILKSFGYMRNAGITIVSLACWIVINNVVVC